MPTIKDVAKYAGVSHGTVSNVLKGMSSVSLEKVRKVEEAIQILGYKPDTIARNLKANISTYIGIVLPNITDSFYAQVYTFLEQLLHDNGYETILHLTAEVAEAEKRILNTLQSIKPAGIIIATCQPNNLPLFDKLMANNIPTVFLDRDIEGLDCNFVGFRNDKTIHYAVKTLLNEGFTRIGLIAGSDLYSSERLCISGYRRAHTDLGFPVNEHYIHYTNGRNEDAFKAAIHLMSFHESPDAIICTGTQLTSGALGAMKYVSQYPRILTLSEDTWNDNRFTDTTVLPRSSLHLSDTVAHLLLDNIRNPAFFEYRKILLNNVYTYIEKKDAPTHFSVATQNIRVNMIEGDMAEALRSLLPELRREKGIEVELETYPHESLYNVLYEQSLKSDVDVFLVDILWLREMSSRGILTDLTSKIDDQFLEDLDIQPELFDDFSRYNGHVYGIPYQYCNQLLYYRKDLFENTKYRRMFYEQYKTELKHPRSWAEYNAIARFFTRAYNTESPTTYGTTLGGRFSSAALCEFLPRFWAYGAEEFDHHARATLDSPNAVKALNNYCDSFQYASPNSPNHWWHEQVAEFAQGDVAMMMMYSSYVSSITDRSISNVSGKIGVSEIPGSCPVLGGWSFSINHNSKRFDTALSFIRWACGKNLAIPLTLLGSLSASRTIYTSNEIRSIYPWVQKSLAIYPTSRHRSLPNVGKQTSIKRYEEIIAQAVHNCIIGKDQPESALAKASLQLNTMLEGETANTL